MHAKMRHLQKPFYKAYALIKLSVKWMRNTAPYGILTILILGSAPIIAPIALSYLTQNITINSSGKILTIKTPITARAISEIRGVFFHESIFGYSHDWNTIAETLADYGINLVVVNDFRIFSRRPYSEIRAAIDAFHSKGIAYHSLMLTIAQSKNNADPSSTAARTHTGDIYSEWQQCPIKVHDYVLSDVQNYLANFPDVDGIMLDYMRYIVQDMCYCDECKAAFEAWLGEGTIADWTPFYPNGARWTDYAEWRSIPINTLVKDIHDTIKSINPNILVSATAFPLFDDTATYQRKWLGQDIAYWIKEGSIDFVAPMMYTKTIPSDTGLEGYCTACMKYWMDGQPEGKIPLVAFLRVDWDTTDLTPEEFATQVNYVRSKGLDGWLIFRYGGPGDSEPTPDITQYLGNITLPNTFSIRNIQVSINNETSATITWLIDLPATSKIEYNILPLFNASWEIWGDFHYWNITYTPGAVVEDNANVTNHSITLTNLSPNITYYYRIQSRDKSGIATSKPMTLTTSV